MRTQATGARSLFSLFSSKESVLLLFFLEEKKQKKINCGAGFPAAPAAFAGLQHKNGQLACERPFFVPRRMCEKRLFYACYPQPLRLLFLFFKKRNRPPSFLFRRKNRSACAGSAGPQTDGRRHILRCRRSEYHSGYASLLRLVFARVRRACASAFPCKPTTQKKIICGTGILYTPAVFPNALHKTDGSYVNRPFFFVPGRTCGKAFFPRRTSSPAMSFVSFLQEKKSFPCRRKENVLL